MARSETREVGASGGGFPLTAEHPQQRTLLSETYVPRVMPPILGTLDMTALFVLAVFWISNITGVVTGGAAGFTYWILCAVTFLIPCAIVITQLGVMFPHEGSLYNWTYQALGGFWSFFISLCGWLPGVLSLVSAAFVVVNCLQTLNSQWLVTAWQQGFAIIGVIILVGILSIQRTRMVQNIINYVAVMIALTVLLLGLAGIIWLLQGKPSATNLGDISGWAINLNPQTGNVYLLGTVTLALLGANMPLNMGGEIANRGAITRHLLWGTLFVLVSYLVVTFAVLVVEGQNAAFSATNSVTLLIDTVDRSLGRVVGDITFIGIILFFLVVGVFENCISARLLMVAAIDNRLPKRLGQLNKHRVPVNALVFQTVVAVFYTAIIFFIVPNIALLGNTNNLTIEAYTVTAAGLLLVWAFSFIFPFLNLAVLYFRDQRTFLQKCIFPLPVLWGSIVLGPMVCVAAIVDTLLYSWLPTLIPNSAWWEIVGGITAICLILSAIGTMFARSEAYWEEMSA